MASNMRHPLDTYFEANPQITTKDFCKAAGVSTQSLWRLRRGDGECSTKLIRRVAAATKGAVSEIQLIAAFESAKRKLGAA